MKPSALTGSLLLALAGAFVVTLEPPQPLNALAALTVFVGLYFYRRNCVRPPPFWHLAGLFVALFVLAGLLNLLLVTLLPHPPA